MTTKDMEYYFKPNKKSDLPLSNRSPTAKPLRYFQHLEHTLGYKSGSLHVATVTIGNKMYGSMSYIDQYQHVIKTIKQTYKYHGDTKYWFCFELQNNGQLHAHGIIYNGYQGKFADGFQKFGSRNYHDKSYQPLRNKGYLEEYIHKEVNKRENRYIPPIHNILKKDIRSIPQLECS